MANRYNPMARRCIDDILRVEFYIPAKFFEDIESLAPRLAIFSHITHSNNLLVLKYDGINGAVTPSRFGTKIKLVFFLLLFSFFFLW